MNLHNDPALGATTWIITSGTSRRGEATIDDPERQHRAHAVHTPNSQYPERTKLEPVVLVRSNALCTLLMVCYRRRRARLCARLQTANCTRLMYCAGEQRRHGRGNRRAMAHLRLDARVVLFCLAQIGVERDTGRLTRCAPLPPRRFHSGDPLLPPLHRKLLVPLALLLVLRLKLNQDRGRQPLVGIPRLRTLHLPLHPRSRHGRGVRLLHLIQPRRVLRLCFCSELRILLLNPRCFLHERSRRCASFTPT